MRVSGIVVKGDGDGTKLGYPTANLDTTISLPSGVYPAWTTYLGERLPSVVCVGVVGRDGTLKNEVHLIDFSGDLYGKRLDVEVIEDKISSLESISDVEALRSKIAQDIKKASYVLRHH